VNSHTVDTRYQAPSAPPLHSMPVIGAASELRRDYLGTVLRAAREVGDVARIDAGPPGWRMTFYTVSAPDLILGVLGEPARFTKSTPSYQEVRWAFGNGMLTSEGEVWLRQRRFLAPMFTRKRILTSYADIIVDEVQRLVRQWRAAAGAGAAVDAHADMVGVTSRVIGRVLFGADMTTVIPELLALRHVNDALLRRGIAPHAVPISVPTPANRRLKAGVAKLRRVVADIIAGRRTSPPADGGGDMLGLLLHARDEGSEGDRLTDAEVADQVLIFLLAGQDTTATTLACLLVELARSPVWQRSLQAELNHVVGARAPKAEDLGELPLTGWAVREAMRLYPAAHSIGRRNVAEEILGGYRLPARSNVVVSPWVVHRSPKVWKNPDTFDPMRFDVPAGQFPGGHRYAWFPFGAGPHACVGMQLAMLEAPLVLATILQEFRLTTDLRSIPLKAAISLHPATPLPVRLHR
jgi:cytochrome P450